MVLSHDYDDNNSHPFCIQFDQEKISFYSRTNPTTSRLLYDHHSYYILGMHNQTATKKMLLALGEVKNYLLHLNIINLKLVSKMLLSVMVFIDINPVFLLL